MASYANRYANLKSANAAGLSNSMHFGNSEKIIKYLCKNNGSLKYDSDEKGNIFVTM